MVKKEQKNHTPEQEKSGKRYLKKFEIVETDVELPIQGQVRDPEYLYKFLKDLENENVSKIIGIYLFKELRILRYVIEFKNYDYGRQLYLIFA